MARTRDLKPGFFDDEDLATKSAFARLLFAGLFVLADRSGRLEDRPMKIRAAIFPYEPLTDVEGLLAELEQPKRHGQTSASLITRYIGQDGRRYLQVNNFGKHQHFHPKEMASKLPGPPEPRRDTDEPRQAATSRGETLSSRPVCSGPSGPSGPSAAAASLSPDSEQVEGESRGGTESPVRAVAVLALEASGVELARMRLASAAARVAALPFGGGDAEALLLVASHTDAGAAFSTPDACGSLPWLQVTLDRLSIIEHENRNRAALCGLPWAPADRGPPGQDPVRQSTPKH